MNTRTLRAIIACCTALTISFVWTYTNKYEYVGTNIYILEKVNIFPFTLWTLGLTALFFVHEAMPKRFRFGKTVLLYLIVLGILEAFGYHVLGIRLNSNEPSLWNLGIIHAKPHMKTFYLVAGPVYIAILTAIFHANKNTRRIP